LEAGAQSPDGHCWVTYSMNKEDIWVSKIPVPVTTTVTQDVDEVFSQMPDGKELAQWNIYSPSWAPVRIEKQEGNRSLVLRDADPFDYAKAERIVPAATKMSAAFTVTALQNNQGLLNVEFLDAKGTPGIRLAFDSTGYIRVKAGYRYRNLMKYDPRQEYTIKVELNLQARMYQVTINGKNSGNNILFAPLESVQRITFRTGEVRRFPDADTPTDQLYDLPHTGDKAPEAVYLIRSLNTKRL
jgi:hypothetical protein